MIENPILLGLAIFGILLVLVVLPTLIENCVFGGIASLAAALWERCKRPKNGNKNGSP